MNKTELIEAIQQVIVPNNQKAVTAESLANLLIEMVEAMGTGSGSGSGQVVFYAGTPSEDKTEFVLTPEQKAHNAEMVQVVKNSPIALCASIDTTELTIADMELGGLDATELKYNFTCSYTSYWPAHLIEAQGLGATAGVVSVSEIPFFIAEDGSVYVLF